MVSTKAIKMEKGDKSRGEEEGVGVGEERQVGGGGLGSGGKKEKEINCHYGRL